MPEIKNTFIQGKMNKDLDPRIIPPGEYVDAKNIKVSRSENGDIGVVENILSNKKIDGPVWYVLSGNKLEDLYILSTFYPKNKSGFVEHAF